MCTKVTINGGSSSDGEQYLSSFFNGLSPLSLLAAICREHNAQCVLNPQDVLWRHDGGMLSGRLPISPSSHQCTLSSGSVHYLGLCGLGQVAAAVCHAAPLFVAIEMETYKGTDSR
jgi:hypothetical protein